MTVLWIFLDAVRTRLVAVLGYANLVPGGQTLDVRGEVILAHDGHAHAEDRLAQQTVCARGPGSVNRTDLDDDVVYSGHV